jgi:hypothetical protein
MAPLGATVLGVQMTLAEFIAPGSGNPRMHFPAEGTLVDYGGDRKNRRLPRDRQLWRPAPRIQGADRRRRPFRNPPERALEAASRVPKRVFWQLSRRNSCIRSNCMLSLKE